MTQRSVRQARLDDMIEIECKSFNEWTENAPEGVLVSNPPYGERLRPENIEALYKGIGTTLKTCFKGWHAWLIGYRDEHFDSIGLKPSVKIPLLNGNLECCLREYVIFDGSYSDFRADGGSIGNLEHQREREPKKMRHISDDEWKKESRKFGGGRKGGSDRKSSSDHRKDYPADRKRDRDYKKREPRRDKRQAIEVSDRGPRIPKSQESVISKVYMRSRKGWKKGPEEEED